MKERSGPPHTRGRDIARLLSLNVQDAATLDGPPAYSLTAALNAVTINPLGIRQRHRVSI